MGNVVKIQGQTAIGQSNRILSLVPFLKRRDNTSKFKLLYYEFDLVDGLIKKPLPLIFKSKKNTRFEYTESPFSMADLSYKPYYDIIYRDARPYYCIQIKNSYFLYDDDLGNPLKADIVDDKGNKYVIPSKTKANTLKIINSLPEDAVVYSLKVTNDGIVKGSDEFKKFDLKSSKKVFEKSKKEKTTDKTRTLFKKRQEQQKKIDELRNS
jgi:hypothetical protein